jgi:hypothetical protein
MIHANINQLFTFYNSVGCEIEPLRTFFHCDLTYFPPKTQWTHMSVIQTSNQTFTPTTGIEYSSNWKNTTPSIQVSGIYEEGYEPFTFPLELRITNVSLLKSQLQKCVRRKHTELAVLTGWTLMKLDFEQFIRRLAIIMNEDVYLHTDVLPVIVWITSACTHGYQPSLKVVMWLLGVIKGLCETEYYDPTIISHTKHDNFNYTKIDTEQLTEHEINFLYSLLFRRSFGGLLNDIVMMNNSLCEWHTRFLEKTVDYETIQMRDFVVEYVCPPIDVELTNNHILISSLDFHVYPNILELIFVRFENVLNDYVRDVMKIDGMVVSQDDIKGIIWHFSSGINVRTKYYDSKKMKYMERKKTNDAKNELYQTYARLWEIIKPEYYLIAYKRIMSIG